MKYKLIIYLILLSNIGFTQDWNPFVLNQNSYYKQQFSDRAEVKNYFLDSINENGNNKTFYFQSKVLIELDCYQKIKNNLEHYPGLGKRYRIDSLLQRNDSVLFISEINNDIDTFIFKPFVGLNETWVSNGITFDCVEKSIFDILDSRDSIKIFNCTGKGFDGVKIILSKNNGFIQFLPLNDFIHSNSTDVLRYLELIGYSKNNSTVGYVQPDFSEYFNLNTGDIWFWQYSNRDGFQYYAVDSIITVYRDNDSIYYLYKESLYSENREFMHAENFAKYHLRNREGSAFKNQIDWFGIEETNSNTRESFIVESLHYKIIDNDTISYARIHKPGTMVSNDNCSVFTMPGDGRINYSTLEGESSMIWDGEFGISSLELIGSIIDGKRYGDTGLTNSVITTSIDNIIVYPNPFDDYLSIDSENETISLVEIVDATGANRIIPKFEKGILDLRKLSTGIYILKITYQNGKVSQIKIMKR